MSNHTRPVHSGSVNELLMSIPIPDAFWKVVSMDVITGLPIPDGFDAILMVEIIFSKCTEYAAVHVKDDAQIQRLKYFFML